jgi:hypothetical protein
MIDIPPGMVRRIDIAHLSTQQPTYSINGALTVPIRFILDRQSLNTLREVVAGLEYKLELSVSGSNCRTTLFRVRLAFGGTWIGPDSVNPFVHGSLRVEEVAQQSLSPWAKAGALNRMMRRG